MEDRHTRRTIYSEHFPVMSCGWRVQREKKLHGLNKSHLQRRQHDVQQGGKFVLSFVCFSSQEARGESYILSDRRIITLVFVCLWYRREPIRGVCYRTHLSTHFVHALLHCLAQVSTKVCLNCRLADCTAGSGNRNIDFAYNLCSHLK